MPQRCGVCGSRDVQAGGGTVACLICASRTRYDGTVERDTSGDAA